MSQTSLIQPRVSDSHICSGFMESSQFNGIELHITFPWDSPFHIFNSAKIVAYATCTRAWNSWPFVMYVPYIKSALFTRSPSRAGDFVGPKEQTKIDIFPTSKALTILILDQPYKPTCSLLLKRRHRHLINDCFSHATTRIRNLAQHVGETPIILWYCSLPSLLLVGV